MYRDLNGFYERRESPRKPEKKPPRLTPGQQKLLMWALGLELLLLFLAPVGGVSIVSAFLYIAR
ncbi:hypothetical protein [Rhizobium mayense]|uniref:Uncharacterized protein n=1 Tax=Rhizobium mayense TaxID=1312184 RepID=A0ABT7JWB2_9HYPH|nr:hypothetical protein [Rhizobium mayense]MDL2400612.1 hypothetical protein [Rhizobium mayense]